MEELFIKFAKQLFDEQENNAKKAKKMYEEMPDNKKIEFWEVMCLGLSGKDKNMVLDILQSMQENKGE